LLLAAVPAGFAQDCCNNCVQCQRFDCPPCYKWCHEGGPRIWVQCGCPKPVCCPSNAPNWGYFPTCWRPWPWPPDWSHCYGNPPAAQIVPPMADARMLPPESGPTPGQLPLTPKR
jgi:hypothetical protein